MRGKVRPRPRGPAPGRPAVPFRDPFGGGSNHLPSGPPPYLMETITSEQPTLPPQGESPNLDDPVVPRRSPLRAAIKTGRPKEWIKNVFVFAGLLFSGHFKDGHDILLAFLTFFAFCFISSAGYFVNDLIDVELDRKHPKKRYRPLAAREISERTAMTIAPGLAIVAIGL